MFANEMGEAYKLTCTVEDEISMYKYELNRAEEKVCDITKKNPFVISFVGRFKTGKSSLINALLGTDLLPTRVTTATALITKIVYGKTPRAKFVENGRERNASIAEAQDIILNYKSKEKNAVAEVVFEMPIPWLNNCIELRDTPGMDDSAQDGALEKMALEALEDTDLCVCVYDAGAMISAKEKERTIHINEKLGGNTIFAVNCTNHLNSIERLNEVESLAKNFFGEMKHSQYAPNVIGKYFMMCTAPRMVDLDGFDISLKNLLLKVNYAAQKSLRQTASTSRLKAKRKEISERAESRRWELAELEEKLNKIHRETIKEKREAILKVGNAEAAEIRRMEAGAKTKLVDMTGLKVRLENYKKEKDWKENYSKKSREITERLLKNNFAEICKIRESNWFHKEDDIFIHNSLTKLSFPDAHITYTTKRDALDIVAGTLGIAAALFGNPAGAHAAMRMIEGETVSTDESVSYTMNFVETEVSPMIQQLFSGQIAEKARTVKRNAEREANECKSGLEEIISAIKRYEQILQEKYIFNDE